MAGWDIHRPLYLDGHLQDGTITGDGRQLQTPGLCKMYMNILNTQMIKEWYEEKEINKLKLSGKMEKLSTLRLCKIR